MKLCNPYMSILLSLSLAGCVTYEPSIPADEESMACISPIVDQLVNADLPTVVANHEDAKAAFLQLVETGSQTDLRTAWKLAALCPSPGMATVASQRLARFSAWHSTDQLFVEVADAVVANHLEIAYPLVRPSFMRSGSLPFAEAMVALDPETASDDFLTYLAVSHSGVAPPESVEFALAHLAAVLPNPRHPMLAVLVQLASDPEGKSARLVAANMLKEYPETFRFNLHRADEETRRRFLVHMKEEHPASTLILQDLL